MDVPNFERAFEHFDSVIYPRFGDTRFSGFHDGAARGWEGYKPKLRENAIALLDPTAWDEGAIGDGAILRHAIAAIEIGGNDQTRNNLVSWEGRYGPGSAGHGALVAATMDVKRRAAFDRWFWDAFRVDEPDPGALFERFRVLAGDGYPLAAYIFFLIDMNRFAPIAPRTFDAAFDRLGIPLRTSGRCAWENYRAYNEALEAVRRRLIGKPGLADTRHIDAHSFLWMMIRMEEERPAGTSAPGAVRYASARRRSIVEMAINAAAAAAWSGKSHIGIHKDKAIDHDRPALERIIERLIDEQGSRCALTGLPLQWRGDSDDAAMLASLDRIDSAAGYSDGNLQVVCRFVNSWKSATPDGEFRRLLAIVRSPLEQASITLSM